jgi:glycosyltransferase involved in cell wall biosynthesis
VSEPRVYIAIAQFLPIIGGAERQALALARSLRQRGYEATVVTIKHARRLPSREWVDGVPTLRVGGWIAGDRDRLPGPLRKIAYAAGVTHVVWTLWWHRRRYDVLSIFQLNLLTLPVTLAGLAAGKAIVVSPRCATPVRPVEAGTDQALTELSDLEIVRSLGPLYVRGMRAALVRARAVMVVLSTRMMHEMVEHDLALPATVIIPNGVDICQFAPLPSASGSEERQRTVVYVGRLSHQKGLDVLLCAWRSVLRDVPEAQLIVIGEGPLEEDLKRQARELGIAESVEFAGRREDIPEQLHRASIAVLPSRYEGLPNAVLEAMASGLACVATRVSGSEDIIRDGETGLLVEPDQPEELAAALRSLLCDPARAQWLGQAAHAAVEHEYSLEQVVSQYTAIYDGLSSGCTAVAPGVGLAGRGAARSPGG